ncbi:GlxA family transcriptional regulator [Streptomyces sp. NPDC059256]|uniref:GlxA family transcriptional regulator n=1 Tax=Streptomyces sp. NPDC059256 TaxID=3346794 RepID=UPI00367410F1
MSRSRKVVIAVFDGVESLDVTGPSQVFATASRLLHGAGYGYSVELAAASAGAVSCADGVRFAVDRSFADLDASIGSGAFGIDTVIVPGALRPGRGRLEPIVEPAVLAWVKKVAPRVRRVASVCAGAHLLAEAGLLTGRRATTHWATADLLAEQYPDVTVDAEAVYVRSDPIWTGAGVSAGIDMSLALVADDLGRRHALATARWMVVYLQRPGNQAQFSTPLHRQSTASPDVAELLAWIDAHLDQPLNVPTLAARLSLGERQFARVFTRETGSTPAAYVETQRIQAARQLLQEDALTVSAIATLCGFGSTETFHRTFKHHTSITPHAYRQRFNTRTDPSDTTPSKGRPP